MTAAVPRAPTWVAALGAGPRRVVEVLRTHGPRTRAELLPLTGLSRPTVSASLAELIAIGYVTEHALPAAESAARSAPGGDDRLGPRAGGRPAALLRLARAAGLAVGVDIGRRHIRVAVADLGHDILTETQVRLLEDAEETPAPVLDLAAKLVVTSVGEVGSPTADIFGVGLGLPAPMTHAGRVAAPPLMPGWAGTDPATELSARLDVPVVVNNDANLGALGEYHWGAGRGCAVLVYVKLATGIGAGIVIDGSLYTGSGGTAGEIGHVTLDARGPLCRCGNRGCVELSAGGRALVEQVRVSHPEVADVADLARLAHAGDAGCRRLLGDAATQVGIALSGLVNLLNPERIVLGGELGSASELMLDPLRRGLSQAAMPAAVDAVTTSSAELGERATVLGAVVSVLRAPAAR